MVALRNTDPVAVEEPPKENEKKEEKGKKKRKKKAPSTVVTTATPITPKDSAYDKTEGSTMKIFDFNTRPSDMVQEWQDLNPNGPRQSTTTALDIPPYMKERAKTHCLPTLEAYAVKGYSESCPTVPCSSMDATATSQSATTMTSACTTTETSLSTTASPSPITSVPTELTPTVTVASLMSDREDMSLKSGRSNRGSPKGSLDSHRSLHGSISAISLESKTMISDSRSEKSQKSDILSAALSTIKRKLETKSKSDRIKLAKVPYSRKPLPKRKKRTITPTPAPTKRKVHSAEETGRSSYFKRWLSNLPTWLQQKKREERVQMETATSQPRTPPRRAVKRQISSAEVYPVLHGAAVKQVGSPVNLPSSPTLQQTQVETVSPKSPCDDKDKQSPTDELRIARKIESVDVITATEISSKSPSERLMSPQSLDTVALREKSNTPRDDDTIRNVQSIRETSSDVTMEAEELPCATFDIRRVGRARLSVLLQVGDSSSTSPWPLSSRRQFSSLRSYRKQEEETLHTARSAPHHHTKEAQAPP